jgi:hypothetical protein
MFGDSDLPAMFADFGAPVIIAGVTVTGIIDLYTDVYEHGGGPGAVGIEQYVLHIPSAAISAAPSPKDQIEVLDSPNLPPEFEPGIYIVKGFPKRHDPSVLDIELKGPVTA